MTIINDDDFPHRVFAEKKLDKRFHKGRFLYINVWRNISDTPIGIGLVWHIDVNPLWHSIIGEMIIKIPNRKWSSGRVWRDLPGQTWWLHCHRLLWQSIQVVGGTGAGTGGGGQKKTIFRIIHKSFAVCSNIVFWTTMLPRTAGSTFLAWRRTRSKHQTYSASA